MRTGVLLGEWYRDVGRTEEQQLPPREAFYSHFSGAEASTAEYELPERVWRVLRCAPEHSVSPGMQLPQQ